MGWKRRTLTMKTRSRMGFRSMLRPYHRSEESHEDNGHECGEDEESEPVAILDDFFCFLFFHYHLLFVVCDGAKVRAGCYKRVSKV